MYENPKEEKFRRLKHSNKMIKERIVDNPHIGFILEMCGFNTIKDLGESFYYLDQDNVNRD